MLETVQTFENLLALAKAELGNQAIILK